MDLETRHGEALPWISPLYDALEDLALARDYVRAFTSSLPRSAIIRVGEFVLPEVMVGMTDASMTRSRSMPRTRN